MSTLFIDFETRSACDLKTCGSDVYAKHPTTDVLCLAYAFDEGPVKLWTPAQSFPDEVASAVYASKYVVGHNIGGFEWYIWNYCLTRRGYTKAPLAISQCHDTMAMSLAMGLPGSLEDSAIAAGIAHQKDKSGHRVMLQLSQPRTDNPLTWWDKDEFKEKYDALYKYCMQDVEVERALYKRLAKLPERSRKVWVLDQRINQRGVGIDVESAKNAEYIIGMEQDRLNAELQRLTGHQVSTYNSHAQFTAWLRSIGVETESVAKAEVIELLQDKELPPVAREALLIRQEAAKSSTAKLKAMVAGTVGGRSRNLFAFHGATTGRWAGRRIQLQNLPRSKLKYADILDCFTRFHKKDAAREIDMLHGSPMSVIADCLRSMLVPAPGNRFICADYANIEGRGLAWLAGEEWKLQAFREFDAGEGPDNYRMAYARAFKIPIDQVTDDQRQIGKVMELACGYQGGVGAFQSMSKIYGVKVSDEKADELKTLWRDVHPAIRNYWYALEEAAVEAIENPGRTTGAGPATRRIAYLKSGSFLCCRLPSGRIMYYPNAKVEEIDTPWGDKKLGITYWAVDSMTRKFSKCKTYGGSLAENITQAVCADILMDGMIRVEEAGYPVVIHVHDEIVAEAPESSNHSLKDFERLMATVPAWAKDFPIAAKGWEGPRYRK